MRVPAAVVSATVALCAALGLPNPALAAPPADHPILGIWKLSLPDLGCHETYRFRADGTTLVTSAEEVSESEYRIPDKPSARGFYRLDDRIVKDNGKKDCAGAIMKPGTTATNFIRFHPSNAIFLMCADETMNACIGPFERVKGEEA
ncbi:hypothetical protein [Massilia sp. BKSP1R2A-1]|jgi:hypothetical protein|uniref:hypothetical protein n=1 Tax=Massilia sp. BKSP1R2A-1 TaxID=3422595 RepID=UPI003D329C5E